MYETLLIAHAMSGAVALLGAAGAIGSRLFGWKHAWHVRTGNAFTLGMLGVALTGLAITLVNPNLFLLSLAIFLLYLSVIGWRYAKARGGMQSGFDKALSIAFVATFIGMIGYGVSILMQGTDIGWVMIVFGGIGVLQSDADLRGAFGNPVTGKTRIAAHLSRMLGGTIGVLTAFLLVQLETDNILVWLGPTIVLTPLIAYWSRKVRGGWLPRSPLKKA